MGLLTVSSEALKSIAEGSIMFTKNEKSMNVNPNEENARRIPPQLYSMDPTIGPMMKPIPVTTSM